MKIQTIHKNFGGGVRSGSGCGDQVGWERRIEVYVKIKKNRKWMGEGGGRFRGGEGSGWV